MNIYIYIQICTYVYVCIHIYVCIYVCIYRYLSLFETSIYIIYIYIYQTNYICIRIHSVPVSNRMLPPFRQRIARASQLRAGEQPNTARTFLRSTGFAATNAEVHTVDLCMLYIYIHMAADIHYLRFIKANNQTTEDDTKVACTWTCNRR